MRLQRPFPAVSASTPVYVPHILVTENRSPPCFQSIELTSDTGPYVSWFDQPAVQSGWMLPITWGTGIRDGCPILPVMI